jgi:ketosteroid isomerase-like protein
MDYQNLLRQLYQDFNKRNFDAVLAHLHEDVAWPRAWEGGYVHGHDQVRAYWLRQGQQLDAEVTPVSFLERPDGQIEVSVHQVVKDLAGQVMADVLVTHVYTFEEGKVKTMAIEQG